MNKTNVSQIFLTTSTTSYLPNDEEVEWIEDTIVAGFRVWQLAGLIISVLIAITVGLCCCIKFRIPRTKQEIEADWIRKKITRNFRQELNKIADKEMDEMDLKEGKSFYIRTREEFNNNRNIVFIILPFS